MDDMTGNMLITAETGVYWGHTVCLKFSIMKVKM